MIYCWAYKGQEQKKKIVIYSDRTMDDLLFPFLNNSSNVILLFHRKKKKKTTQTNKNYTSYSLGFESTPECLLRQSQHTPSPFFPDGKVVSRGRWPSSQNFSQSCPSGSITYLNSPSASASRPRISLPTQIPKSTSILIPNGYFLTSAFKLFLTGSY